jgi:uncharacterized protein YgiM (DUF1202 family)
MKLKSTVSHPDRSNTPWTKHPRTKAILASVLSLATLAACSRARTDLSAQKNAPVSPSEFTFPQVACGDRTGALNQTSYPVYIEGANLDNIRKKYCGDAVSATREKTGKSAVQVASFSSYEKAQRFAKIVGGQVDAAVGQTAPGSPTAQTATAGTTTGSPVGQSGTLTTQESGSPINVRASASTSASIQDTAYGGDTVKIVEKSQGTDGQTWYKVTLSSGGAGWVRGDLVNLGAVSSTSGTTSGTATSSAASRNYSGAIASTRPSPITPGTTTATATATGRKAILTSQEPGSPINVRASASTTAEVQEVAYAGDEVQVGEKLQGDDGQTWYKVQSSAGAGWVRGDFISVN